MCGRSEYSGITKDKNERSLLTIMIFLAFLFYYFIYAIDQRNYYDSDNFMVANGKINYIEHGKFKRRGGSKYGVHVKYSYMIEGAYYHGDSYTINSNYLYFKDFDDYQSKINKYLVGNDISVFYYKYNNDVSVLNIDDFYGYDYIKRGLPVFVFITLLLIYSLLRKFRKVKLAK